MNLITEQELIDHLIHYQNACTADGFGVDMSSLIEFITPETDLYLLTLLSKSMGRGLNLSQVDKEKFLREDFGNLPYNVSDIGPWANARYSTFDLSSILKDKESFIYHGHVEGLGFDFTMNAMLLISDTCDDFLNDLESTNGFSCFDTEIRTVNDLLQFLNEGIRKDNARVSKRKNWLFGFFRRKEKRVNCH